MVSPLWQLATGFVFIFFATFVPVALFAVLPLAVCAARQGVSRRRAFICTGVGYLVVAIYLGLFAYWFVPVQYTKYGDWSQPQTTNSEA